MASDTNIGFIHAPGLIGGFQMKPSSLFEFRSVELYASLNGGVIHPQVPLLEKLLDLAFRMCCKELGAGNTLIGVSGPSLIHTVRPKIRSMN